MNGVNVNSVRCDASRHFRDKKGEYLKEKMHELAKDNKNKNIRKQANLQLLQDSSEIRVDNLNSIRCEDSRHFKNRKGNIGKTKLLSLQ
jgi:hypothetical protein